MQNIYLNSIFFSLSLPIHCWPHINNVRKTKRVKHRTKTVAIEIGSHVGGMQVNINSLFRHFKLVLIYSQNEANTTSLQVIWHMPALLALCALLTLKPIVPIECAFPSCWNVWFCFPLPSIIQNWNKFQRNCVYIDGFILYNELRKNEHTNTHFLTHAVSESLAPAVVGAAAYPIQYLYRCLLEFVWFYATMCYAAIHVCMHNAIDVNEATSPSNAIIITIYGK